MSSGSERPPGQLLSDEEVEQLPSDPIAAFVALDDLLRPRVKDSQRIRKAEFGSTLHAFIAEHTLGITLPNLPSPETGGVFDSAFVDFCLTVDKIKAGFRFRRQRQSNDGVNVTLALTSEEKQEVRAHLERIRNIVEKSGLADRKRNAIFTRIAELAKEIDKSGTRVDSIFAFWMDAAMFSAQATEYSQPFVDEVKDLLRIVYKAKARNEGVALPPPKNLPMLGKD